jgi:heptaprenylglyceryl phosphate synthase
MGFRMPVFDVKVSAQKKNVYTTVTQNELALQFFQMGFFNPQMTDQALMCLDLMEFDGKDTVMQKVSQNGTMFQKLTQYMQLSLMLAQKAAPEMVAGLSQDVMATVGGGVTASQSAAPSAPVTDQKKQEPTLVANARERAAEASQPDGAVARKGEKK